MRLWGGGDSPAPGYPSIQHLALGGEPQGEGEVF